MSRAIAKAVKEAVDALHSFEEELAKKGFTFEDWEAHQEIRFGIWKSREDMEAVLGKKTDKLIKTRD